MIFTSCMKPLTILRIKTRSYKTNIENSYSTFCKALCGIKTVQRLFNLK